MNLGDMFDVSLQAAKYISLIRKNPQIHAEWQTEKGVQS
jgi:hypothetical protein